MDGTRFDAQARSLATSRSRRSLLITFAAGLLGVACNFENFGNSLRQGQVERVTQQLSVGGISAIIIISDAGSIELTSGADNVVNVVAEKRAPTSGDLQQMQVSTTNQNDEVHVTYQDSTHGQRSVDFKVSAPKNARVQIQTAGGSIMVAGFANDVSAHTSGGSISIKNQSGSVTAQTEGGSISIDGSLTGNNTATTTGGSINATIPADSNLRVSATTNGGSVSSDFGLPVEGSGNQRAQGAIGDGSKGSLTLKTSGGSIAVRKR